MTTGINYNEGNDNKYNLPKKKDDKKNKSNEMNEFSEVGSNQTESSNIEYFTE